MGQASGTTEEMSVEDTEMESGLSGDVEEVSTLSIPEEKKETISILVVDDDESLCQSCGNVLQHEGYDVRTTTRGTEARDLVRRRPFDIVLLDLYMTQVSGMDLLELILEEHPETIVVVMTGKPSVDSSLQALRAGAWDYLPKPFSGTHVQVLIGRAAHTVLVGRETEELKGELQKRHGHGTDGVTLLGSSGPFRQALSLAKRVAPTDASVFLTGESGTGKELFAQFIHQNSRRSSRRLVAVNCAALPEQLLESEMFGHVEGAFTGAVRDKPGLLEAANGGTLFLDELTEMPLPVQAKLLRVIQDGVVRRVGSTGTDAVVNVRFLAATNRDPESAVEDGHLREDLYYRLRVVPIRIPPLRERPEDIEILAEHFLATFWDKHRKNGSRSPEFTDEARQALRRRAWKGNVRELENVMEHAVVLMSPGEDVRPEDIPDFEAEGQGITPREIPSLSGPPEKLEYHEARDRVLGEFERNYLRWIVREAEGNMSEAARIASVDRTTLYRLMEKHDLSRDDLVMAAREG